MRTIERTAKFRRDYKTLMKGQSAKVVAAEFVDVLALLLRDQPLPKNKFDHGLSGEWADFRDCHVLPDVVLIYRKPFRGA